MLGIDRKAARAGWTVFLIGLLIFRHLQGP